MSVTVNIYFKNSWSRICSMFMFNYKMSHA